MTEGLLDGIQHRDRRRSLRDASLGDVQPQNLLLDSFPAEIVSDLQPYLRRRHFRAGEIIHDAGDPILEVCFPVSALVALQAILSDGHSIDVVMAGRESAIGIGVGMSCNTAVNRAMTQIAGDVDVISADRFVSIVSGNRAASGMIARYGDVLLMQSQQLACCCSHHLVSARLATWLLHCRDCTGKDELSVTQELAAQSLGVRRTTVTMAAHDLQAAGVIRYRRGRLKILDDGSLRATSCECYEATRAQTNSILWLNNRF